MRWILSFVLLLLTANFVLADEELKLPALTARVTDLTGTFTSEQKASLEAKLANFETQKGSQVVVVLIPSTKPEEIEEYSIRLAEKWKIGRKGVDDGVILLIAKQDRKLRIEVGYGLEGSLTDYESKKIIDRIITPFFKQGDFYQGVNAGVDAIVKVISGEKLPEPSHVSSGADNGAWFPIFMFIGLPFTAYLRSKKYGTFLSALIPSFISFLIMLFFMAWPVALIFSFFVLSFLTAIGASGRGGSWHSGRGGGSFGGGGFSGGGGSFGGGGASGGW